ncbi:paraquat-inducible protein A [Puniceibacterium confluentis]|uniref:paraquat-inducible protein A n=1 Tax=Puniceibacterium confluentis TaxID=1958944 RepID=UPI0011B653A7|nr:paraquat-inducible protein A [Puniceibacterium confluentis]
MRWLNLSLLILYPIAWSAPLLRAGLLPLFSLSEISVLTGIRSLWDSDIFLALVVTAFALVAPYLKTLGLALMQFGWITHRMLPLLTLLGKLAMADIFLVALYITLSKGIGVGRIEIAWGLYLMTACILMSLGLSLWHTHRVDTGSESATVMPPDHD